MLWSRDNKLVVDAYGHPIDCDHCPCPVTTITCVKCADGSLPTRMFVTFDGFSNSDTLFVFGLESTFNNRTFELVQSVDNPCVWKFSAEATIHDYSSLTNTSPPEPEWYEISLSVFASQYPSEFSGFVVRITDNWWQYWQDMPTNPGNAGWAENQGWWEMRSWFTEDELIRSEAGEYASIADCSFPGSRVTDHDQNVTQFGRWPGDLETTINFYYTYTTSLNATATIESSV